MKACTVAIFMGCFFLGYSQTSNVSLSCYQCDTFTSPATCQVPNNSTNSVNFTSFPPNQQPFCYSESLNNTNLGLVIIYRGVRVTNQYSLHPCDSIISSQNITRIACDACNTTNCNVHVFDAAGNITGGESGGGGGSSSGSGGNEIISPSSLVFLLTLTVFFDKHRFYIWL